VEELDEDAAATCMVAVKASPRRAFNSRATAHAATLVAVVITEIVIMAIGVAVLSLAVVVTVRVPEARLFTVVGKATHILTFHVIGDSMPVVGILGFERGPMASSSFLANSSGNGKKDESEELH
jgi:hypothetical protein